MSARIIFITGGVVSSLGKGLASAALGALLQARGYHVRLRKLDPYLNVDPGTMSPYQHGECYVTDDGAETDLDLGHYERFTGVSARQSDNVTTGRIYADVIARERRGDYLGGTVQVIPHVTDAIRDFILADIKTEDFVLCEIGGTVGDIEGLPFLEAIRQMRNDLGIGRTAYIHVTLLPHIDAAGELKTKPTQHSVKELLSVGIQPDILLCRTARPIPDAARRKIALFCNVRESRVIPAPDVDVIYDVPNIYHRAGFDVELLRHFDLLDPAASGQQDANTGHAAGTATARTTHKTTDKKTPREIDLGHWQKITNIMRHPEGQVEIAMVGKYTMMPDAYKSLTEALTHGGVANNVRVDLRWLDAEEFETQSPALHLEGVHGILAPGGFGKRGSEGKIAACRFARVKHIPFFGICFGMQMAVVETMRHLAGAPDAGSSEFGPCGDPVVGLLTEWTRDNKREIRDAGSDKGGSMRLGAYPCLLAAGSRVADIYGRPEISERHRHRYEVNIAARERLQKAGMIVSGLSPDGHLPEIVERTDHPWFIGVQFHPELKSRPFAPHPLFRSFIGAAVRQSRLV